MDECVRGGLKYMQPYFLRRYAPDKLAKPPTIAPTNAVTINSKRDEPFNGSTCAILIAITSLF